MFQKFWRIKIKCIFALLITFHDMNGPFNIISIVPTIVIQFIYYVIMPVLVFQIMCISPIPIPNPYLSQNVSFYNKHLRRVFNTYLEKFVSKDTHSKYILVPCGHCKECLTARRSDIVQRCEMESLNKYPFFITLTYDNAHLPKMTLPDGKVVSYSSREYIKDMFKRIRRHQSIPRSFRYLAVTERGASKSRPHHHILLYLDKAPDDDEFTPYQLEELLFNLFRDEWKCNLSDDPFNPHYEPLYIYKRVIKQGKINSTFDLHYVRPYIDDYSRNVSLYVFKYITKISKYEQYLFNQLKTSLSPSDFDHYWRLLRSGYTASRFWGTQSISISKCEPSEDVANHIKKCVQSYSSGFPTYYSPYSFETSPLAKYYIEKDIFFPESLRVLYRETLRSNGYFQYVDDCTFKSKDVKSGFNIDNDLKIYERLLSISDYDNLQFDI